LPCVSRIQWTHDVVVIHFAWNSLHFVKVTMPNGKRYTLPQVISGSGVRYTDKREILWWTHQGTVRVDMRDAEVRSMMTMGSVAWMNSMGRLPVMRSWGR